MPSSKLSTLHPRNSLRKIRTAFSQSSPPSQENQTPDVSSTCSTSPLSAAASSIGSRLSTFSFGNTSNLSLCSAVNPRRVIRRKKSAVQLEQEEERSLVRDDLMALIEPRPSTGNACGGIEEVLSGRV